MNKTTCVVFYKDSVDTNRKAICVFNKDSVSKKDMINIIAKYLQEEEMDDDDDFAPLQSVEDCLEEAENIVNGGLLDLDMDSYFIDEEVVYYQ